MSPALILLLVQLAPELIPLGKSLVSLFKAHPQLTLEQIAAFVSLVQQSDDTTRAFIIADQANHPA